MSLQNENVRIARGREPDGRSLCFRMKRRKLFD
jgi:hypothetical protein